MDFEFLINSCYLFKNLMNFLDSWVFRVVLDKIFNKICRLIYNAYFDNYSHEYKTRRILDLDKILFMEVDGPLKAMGEYVTCTGFWTRVSVILGIGLGDMNLNHFTEKSCSPTSVAHLFKTCSPGSGGYGEAKELESLTWLF